MADLDRKELIQLIAVAKSNLNLTGLDLSYLDLKKLDLTFICVIIISPRGALKKTRKKYRWIIIMKIYLEKSLEKIRTNPGY